MVKKPRSNTSSLRVGTLLYDNFLGTSATLPVEMLRTAQASARARDPNARQISAVTLSINHQPVVSPSGFNIVPSVTIADTEPYDIISLPALWRNPRHALNKYRDYIPWLQQQVKLGATVIAVGTGVCFLAEAGLLDNQPATTHWHYFDRFQKDYPQVELKRQYFVTQAGNLYCAASVNAMAELMVHLVSRLYNRQAATQVERNFFHEIRSSFKPTSYFSDDVQQHPDEQVVQAQIWFEDNFSKPVKITDVAIQFGFSMRTFDRRFKRALGKTPLQYLQTIRLNNARELLQKSNLSVSEIATHCGYQGAASFSKIFNQLFGTSPTKYRETVRAKLFSTH
ncbi:MAG: helix-turn-helix domain-containing protein [Porticoccus sp.]